MSTGHSTFESYLIFCVFVLTVHVVTFGVAHVETGGLHVGGQHVPPFVLVT